jgi:uncharacterized membrane protein YgdD (TMEM256/DUF423 family)
MRLLTFFAAICGLILTAMGAIGAHLIVPSGAGAADPLGAELALRSWNSAILFGFVHTLAALIAARTPRPGAANAAAGWLFLAGVALFSFSLILKAVLLAQSPAGDFGGVTMLAPVGGIAFMLGWIGLGVSALRPAQTAEKP